MRGILGLHHCTLAALMMMTSYMCVQGCMCPLPLNEHLHHLDGTMSSHFSAAV